MRPLPTPPTPVEPRTWADLTDLMHLALTTPLAGINLEALIDRWEVSA